MSLRAAIAIIALASVFAPASADNTSTSSDRYAATEVVLPDSFWTNWYGQFGIDLSLQNPYGYDFSHVFPNGSSVGIDAALGRWFTPALGLRGKFNWENGIIGNNHANWLAPFDHPGVNHRRGGYITMVGDIQLDINNLFWGYDADRKLNFQAFVRAGGLYNFGAKKGSPLIGLGIGATYRLTSRVSLYADMAYQGVSSGHVGNIMNQLDGEDGSNIETGTGTNSNGFFDVNFGVQVNFGKSGFKNLNAERLFVEKERLRDTEVTATNTFWRNWYVQFGMDMTLHRPYKKDFSQVFPKGKTFGLDVAVGKWFSPEIALRARCNWENGFPLFKNSGLEWVASEENRTNMDSGGYLALSIEVPISLTNIIMGYDPSRVWGINVFPRAGLGCNLATGGASPMVGGGVEATYRLNDRWTLVGEYGFQAITSEFYYGVSYTGMRAPTGFNSFMDFQIGAQLSIGPKAPFRRPLTH